MNPHDIKALLGKRGVRQVHLARQLRVSPSLITGVIFRRARSQRVAAAISAAVGKPLDKLFPELARRRNAA
ncbi:MAG TPA: hypothetical protein PKZ76_03430 [Xanthomonadaceae bacterium]|nr:hypothetical protein [Xanthomonadaceae bacterium]